MNKERTRSLVMLHSSKPNIFGMK